MTYDYNPEVDELDRRGLLKWTKASASNPNGNCVEMASLSDGTVAMRDSKNPDGSVLRFTKDEVAAFLDGAKKDEFARYI